MYARDIQMKYDINNPKFVDFFEHPGEDNFTGVVKDKFGDIAYYENGKLHRTDGPAIEGRNGAKAWWHHHKIYGYNDDFTVESWKKKWKLEIFK